MPKLIKKRVEKQEELQTEEEVKSYLSSLSQRAAENSRQMMTIAIAAAVIVLVVAGAFYYKKSQADSAVEHEYTGYKLYYGLYDKQGGAKSQRLADALAEFQKAAGVRKTPSTLYYIGSVYFSMGKYPEAIDGLNALIAAYPGDREFVPLARYRIALAKERMGKNDEALKDLDAIATGSASLRDLALAEGAELLTKLGRQKEARSRYETIIAQFPNSAYREQADAFIKKMDGISNAPAVTPAAAKSPAPAAKPQPKK